MKPCLLAVFALAVSAPASWAKQPPAPAARDSAPAAKATSTGRKAEVAIGQDGQDAGLRCSTQNPNIEYRDCVNASTRDSNAKVRLG